MKSWLDPRVRAILLALAIGLLFAGEAGPAAAQESGVRLYEPSTKNYFELVEDPTTPKWNRARAGAESFVFKGVPGRLAIVPNEIVHRFLRENFKIPTEAWIGLRYWCRTRDLKWINGKKHARSEFSAWDKQWFRNQSTVCGRIAQLYMPVYYTQTGKGFSWQASGYNKALRYYIVEYPTGGK